MKKPASIKNIWDTARASSSHIGSLKNGFSSRIAFFRRNRASFEQEALEKDFNHVLSAWGIEDDDDIPAVIAILRMRLTLFGICLLGCLLLAVWQSGLGGLVVASMIAIPCSLGFVTSLWRIFILRKHKFTPFVRWLTGHGWR